AHSNAKGYYVKACGGRFPFSEKQIGNRVNKTHLPSGCSHNQGETSTCAFHASTILLSALAENKLSVLDMILKMGKTLDDSTDFISALDHFRNYQKLGV